MRVTLPNDWSDITIGKYQEIFALTKLPDTLVLEKDIKMLSIITGLSEDIIGSVDIDDYATMMEQLQFIMTLPSAEHIPTQIKFDGVKYDLQMRVDKLKLAQYIDLELLSKTSDEIIYNMHKILAIFLSNTKQYNTEDMLRRAEIFKAKMTMDIAYPITVFFYLNYMTLLDGIQNYLVEEAKKQVRELNQKLPTTTTRGGNGILFWKN